MHQHLALSFTTKSPKKCGKVVVGVKSKNPILEKLIFSIDVWHLQVAVVIIYLISFVKKTTVK